MYRDCFYNDILITSDNTKKMRDNINLLINKKRPSSHIEKLQVDNKRHDVRGKKLCILALGQIYIYLSV